MLCLHVCTALFFIAYFCFIGKIPFTKFNKRKLLLSVVLCWSSLLFVPVCDYSRQEFQCSREVSAAALVSWGLGRDSPGQWSAPHPTPPSRQSVLCLVTCGLLCLSSGEHFEFCSEAGAQIKDRQIND